MSGSLQLFKNQKESSGNSGFEVQRINPLDNPEWDILVSRHPGGGFFHSSAWARVLARTYSHLPSYFVLHKGGKPAALVPVMEVNSVFTGRRGVCLPFTDFCSPLIFDGFEPQLVLEALSAMAVNRRWRYYELRLNSEWKIPAADPAVSFFAHHLDLQGGSDRLLSSFHSSHRRSIRKAEQSSLQIDIRTDEEAVDTFYRLHTYTRRRHGLPPQPQKFFKNIYQEIIKLGLGFVVLASCRSIPVAGAVFFHSAEEAIYKFGASDEKQPDSRANHLVMWSGIRFLAAQGFRSLHFGRTSSDQEGLRRYKLNWGATETILDYFRFAPGKKSWMAGHDKAAGFHNTFFSRFPLILNRLLGAFIYPHLD